MNMTHAYEIIQNVKHFRELDLSQYNFNVMKRIDLYFVFLEPVNDLHPKWNRTQAFVTEFPEDLENVMNIYEFANSKGAVEYDIGS